MKRELSQVGFPAFGTAPFAVDTLLLSLPGDPRLRTRTGLIQHLGKRNGIGDQD